MNRRQFISGLVTTAAGLVLPYEPKRIYSFPSKFQRVVMVEYMGRMFVGHPLIIVEDNHPHDGLYSANFVFSATTSRNQNNASERHRETVTHNGEAERVVG